MIYEGILLLIETSCSFSHGYTRTWVRSTKAVLYPVFFILLLFPIWRTLI